MKGGPGRGRRLRRTGRRNPGEIARLEPAILEGAVEFLKLQRVEHAARLVDRPHPALGVVREQGLDMHAYQLPVTDAHGIRGPTAASRS